MYVWMYYIGNLNEDHKAIKNWMYRNEKIKKPKQQIRHYKDQKNHLSNLIKEAKKQYISSKIGKAGRNLENCGRL